MSAEEKHSLLVPPQLLTAAGPPPGAGEGTAGAAPSPAPLGDVPPPACLHRGSVPTPPPVTGNHRGEVILLPALFCGLKTDPKLIAMEVCGLGEPTRFPPGVLPPSSGE